MNTSKRNEISEVVDIELSRDEDSVTSLAVARAEDDSIVALAGINSSQAEQLKGNNQHLRSFRLEYPPRKAAAAAGEDTEKKDKKDDAGKKTTPLSRASLFRTKIHKPAPGQKIDTYQRILRLSPWRGADSPRIAAIATGLAPSGEIVLFDATTPTPQESDVLGRIRLGDGEEAEDVDIIDLDGEEKGKKNGKRFKVAYTNGVDVFTFEIDSSRRSNASPEVRCVYTVPFPDYYAKNKARPRFRALRFLSPTALLLLQNAPDRGGCELVVLSLPSSSSSPSSGDGAFGTIIRRRKLRRMMKIGLGLDVCNLGANPDGERQFIVAVSGNDQSIEVLTLEYSPKNRRYNRNNYGGYDKLRPYTVLRDVHPFSMTKLCFSTFTPPAYPVTGTVRPQSVKLASVSMGNTVVVHTLPLSPFPSVHTREPRYVLVVPGHPQAWETAYSGLVALLIVAIGCFLLQAFTEIRGGVPPYLGATEWLPPRIREMVARPYMFENGLPGRYLEDRLAHAPETQGQTPEVKMRRTLRDILAARRAAGAVDLATESAAPPAIVVHHDDTAISVHVASQGGDEAVIARETARRWEDLQPEERESWKRRLVEAGQWAVEEGEEILKGVLFAEVAGAVEGLVARTGEGRREEQQES